MLWLRYIWLDNINVNNLTFSCQTFYWFTTYPMNWLKVAWTNALINVQYYATRQELINMMEGLQWSTILRYDWPVRLL